ncbi:hypothetical protein Tco_0039386 [Tanacetum coccineum]
MNTTQAQQKALDDALVALMDRLEFEKCNMRHKTDIKPKEATIQVVLDALALTPFYQAFLITAESSGTNEGIGAKPGVPDVPKYNSKSKNELWGFSDEEDDDDDEHDFEDDNDDDDDKNVDEEEDDNEETETYNDGDDITHPNLSTYQADDREEEEKDNDDEVYSNQRVYTPPDYQLTEEEENREGDNQIKEGEEEHDKEDDLYGDVNINLERSDAEMTNTQANQDTEDAHYINPSPDASTDSILNQDTQLYSLVNIPVSVAAETPSYVTTIPQPPNLKIQPQQQTAISTTTTTNPTTTLPDVPNFASLFRFEQRVSALETKMSEFKQTSQFVEAISLISGIVDNYLAFKMKDAVDVAVQLQSNKLRVEAQAENEEFLNQIEKYITESLGAKVLVRSANQPQTSYVVAASLSEFKLKKILIDKIEENKSINRSDIQKNLYNALVESYNSDKDIITSYGDVVTLNRGRDDQDRDEDPSLDQTEGRREGNQAKKLSHQKNQHIRSLSPQVLQKIHLDLNQNPQARINDVTPIREALDDESTQSSFNEFLATPIDFYAFIMHQIKIDNLTQEVLTGPTFDLIKGTCKSVVELEYHLEENERSCQVIPFDHFINNDFEYLKGGSLSQRYTTSITKIKATNYGQVKWIKDKVPSIWTQVKVVYDRHAYWGTYHWGPKRQKFYGYASNMETSKDVYSRHKIIVVTSLKIMEDFGYSRLEEIVVRR